MAGAGWRPRRARASIRIGDSTLLRYHDRQDHQPWRRPQRSAGPADLCPGADRRVRRQHESGISDLLPAASRICERRGDHVVHRQAPRRIAGRAGRRQCGSSSGGLAAVRYQSARGALAQWAKPVRDISADDADRSRAWGERDRYRSSARWWLSRRRRWRRVSFRDRRTRRRYDPLPNRRPDGFGKIPARWRSPLYPASRRHDLRP